MRVIENIVVHCTANQPTATVEIILKYWKEVLKWKSPGYHKIIAADGTVTTLAPDTAICNGVANHNSNSLHVSYIGGIEKNGNPKDTRTPAQKAALLKVVSAWKKEYPKARVLGHRDFPGVAKACPSFDAIKWWEENKNNK
jgi:N-acetylmuramoyl-L-alanine amidase